MPLDAVAFWHRSTALPFLRIQEKPDFHEVNCFLTPQHSEQAGGILFTVSGMRLSKQLYKHVPVALKCTIQLPLLCFSVSPYLCTVPTCSAPIGGAPTPVNSTE